MKHILVIAILFVVALGFSACQQPDWRKFEHVALDTTAIKASVDSLGAVVQKAHTTGDDKLLGSTWATDGILSIAGSPPVQGRNAIISALRNMPPPPAGGKMEIHPIEIQVLSPEWAYVFGVDSLIYTPPGAKAPVKETSTFFVLVRKTTEGWQTYREILCPNQPLRGLQK
ncbi:MAG: DUF4440 domain-containing protein [Segetibacter sp.]